MPDRRNTNRSKPATPFRVVLRPHAEEDLVSIASFIATESPLNAQRFVERLLKAISRLAI